LVKCNPAKIELKQEINGIEAVFYSDIQGGSVDYCVIYQQIKSINFPDNMSPVEKMAMQVLVGADSTCVGPSDKLKTGSFDEYEQYFNCSGTLYELMKAGSQQIEQAVEETNENVSADNTSYEEEGRKTLEPTLN